MEWPSFRLTSTKAVSVEELLVGLVDNQVLQPKQLQRLAEKIVSRKEKKS